ncbi:hypothetical protein [Ulvibacter litoralis]|uniref:Lipoprotein n=1 Tax=Ulvibacter litoralis TaxID=227084 RepID=A0A1G7H0X9_9FLAO|nr:hypothetical protein [Ulvibacter litoralis]GHC59300.1 hypothetical protein GCM10008083_25150 [Ulvibacter litoralis]SDE94067.1 hypothetical protein SAMN05421855_103457 [Ulvibacter litoralis]
MKKFVLICLFGLLSVSCTSQNNETNKTITKESEKSTIEQPKGSWKVDKEFDENGNLIRYDSIYSWSSSGRIDDFSNVDKDSLLQSFKSKFFTNFSDFEDQGFETIFSKDSLFSNHFFNDNFFGSDFGKDYMDIDKITQQLVERQKKFLEKYRSEFIKPEDEN